MDTMYNHVFYCSTARKAIQSYLQTLESLMVVEHFAIAIKIADKRWQIVPMSADRLRAKVAATQWGGIPFHVVGNQGRCGGHI